MPSSHSLVHVVTPAQATARDAAAIAAGTPSRVLMDRAGTHTASLVVAHFQLSPGARVLVLTGPGNNGGDGWVVARTLASWGAHVDLVEVAPARAADAIEAREHARREAGTRLRERALDDVAREAYAVVVDAMLGTGATGAPRPPMTSAQALLAAQRNAGARIAAVDLPTGLDAATGAIAGAVPAHLTVTYGTVKRGHLVSRGVCGRIVVVDIGLGAHAHLPDGAPLLVDEPWVTRQVPVLHADVHKGTRKRVVIVGGGAGMSGAAILAARAALRSGAGLVKVLADPSSLVAVQAAEPAALTGPWPDTAADVAPALRSADVVVIGPGLGVTPRTRAMLYDILNEWRGPVVLDADALNLFESAMDRLAGCLAGRPALLTPHPREFARLLGVQPEEVLAQRFGLAVHVAQRLHATILLKGTPTVVTAPDGARVLVSAAGTPALGTGGSGDLLAGICGTLMAQMDDPTAAAACAAWVHGHAAELAQFAERPALPARRDARGLTLDQVMAALPDAWRLSANPPLTPVLAELPSVEQPL